MDLRGQHDQGTLLLLLLMRLMLMMVDEVVRLSMVNVMVGRKHLVSRCTLRDSSTDAAQTHRLMEVSPSCSAQNVDGTSWTIGCCTHRRHDSSAASPTWQ